MAIVLLTIVMPLSFIVSCNDNKKDMVEVVYDPQTSYTLKETNVKGVVSDSGRIRFKYETPTWLVFGKASEPYWYFPDGVYAERFDSAFQVEASIKADTAYNYEHRKIWELKGNVDISNLKGERFQTSQLFWDQNKEEFYSDSFIRITKGESVNTGIGFRSNQDISIYEIYNSTGEIPVDMKRSDTVTYSMPQDSLIIETVPETPAINAPDSNHNRE
jgi:Protein of unknown function (DUF1239).